MKNLRLYVAAGAFVALTAVKLLSPTQTLNLRQNVVSIVTRDDDYRQAVQTLGEKLGFSEKQGYRRFRYEGRCKKTYRPETIDEIRRDFASILPEKTEKTETNKTDKTETEKTEKPEKAVTDKIEPTKKPAETKAPDNADTQSAKKEVVPKVVQTFLDSQAKYSDYAVPADVNYGMPALPFAYAPPVKGVTSSGFGYRMHPILNEIKFHYGTDFAAQSGVDIYAFAAGTVETAEENDSFGKYIVIDHAKGYKTLYAHCGTLYVSAGIL